MDANQALSFLIQLKRRTLLVSGPTGPIGLSWDEQVAGEQAAAVLQEALQSVAPAATTEE